MSARFFMLLLLVLPLGCTQLSLGRNFISDYGDDGGGSFLRPGEDFPVVAGDSGNYWLDEEEIRSRAPSSAEDEMALRHSRALAQELRMLEGSQSDEELKLYNKYRSKLGSTSERIYFLNLPLHERTDYLKMRGILTEKRAPASALHERLFASRHTDIMMGMTKDDVLESWGKPLRVEIAGNPRNENERWLYRMNGASKYIYFESGQVHGWE